MRAARRRPPRRRWPSVHREGRHGDATPARDLGPRHHRSRCGVPGPLRRLARTFRRRDRRHDVEWVRSQSQVRADSDRHPRTWLHPLAGSPSSSLRRSGVRHDRVRSCDRRDLSSPPRTRRTGRDCARLVLDRSAGAGAVPRHPVPDRSEAARLHGAPSGRQRPCPRRDRHLATRSSARAATARRREGRRAADVRRAASSTPGRRQSKPRPRGDATTHASATHTPMPRATSTQPWTTSPTSSPASTRRTEYGRARQLIDGSSNRAAWRAVSDGR